MKKFWIKMNILYERFMLFIFTLILLVVIYGLYDSWYVFSNASDDSYRKYKPEEGQNISDDIPITEDMVAWITIDDTNIDYPVMQGEDNSKYLNINPYGEYALSGSIFLDSRNSGDFTDEYSILYGHHMEYKVMFGALDDYLEEKYLKSHSEGTLLVGRTDVKALQVKVFAAAKVNVFDDSEFLKPDTKDIGSLIKERARVYDESVPASGRILALSTCTEPVSQNRLIVFCYIY
ncbi:MAG: class B sortase [Eubacterium sp.]|nr:class B sortase [Eubacterium sp.]